MFKFRRLLGFKYLLNTASSEVHKLSNLKDNCWIYKMAKMNKKFLTESKYQKLVKSGAKINGCIHCFRETNTD